jgi:hypothetical protein
LVPESCSLTGGLDFISSVTTVDSGKKAMELLGPKGRGKLDSSAAADANVSTEKNNLEYSYQAAPSVCFCGYGNFSLFRVNK